MQTPEDIAKLITEDITTNNGLTLENNNPWGLTEPPTQKTFTQKAQPYIQRELQDKLNDPNTWINVNNHTGTNRLNHIPDSENILGISFGIKTEKGLRQPIAYIQLELENRNGEIWA
jgi:hypothetical protein